MGSSRNKNCGRVKIVIHFRTRLINSLLHLGCPILQSLIGQLILMKRESDWIRKVTPMNLGEEHVNLVTMFRNIFSRERRFVA